MRRVPRLSLAVVLAAALSACSSTAAGPPTSPTGSTTTGTQYGLLTTITSLGSKFPLSPTTTSWVDISDFDGAPLAASGTGNYIVADKANAGVTAVNPSTLKYVLTAGAGNFTGVGKTVNGQREGGPNGIIPIGSSIVFGGDANSNIIIVNVSTGAMISPTSAGCTSPSVLATGTSLPGSGSAGQASVVSGATTICGMYTGGQYRADEGAFDPTDSIVAIGNDEEQSPNFPFLSFWSTTGCTASSCTPTLQGTLTFTDAWQAGAAPDGGGGLEQPVWDPNQKLFLVSVPETHTNANGEIDVINPTTRAIVTKYALSINCSPAGLALNPTSDVVLVGCGNNNGLLVLNAKTGATLATITPAGGVDEAWYNPTDNRFYAAGSNFVPTGATSSSPSLFAIDGSSYKLLQTITTTASAHSVAADPVSNRVFVPVVSTSSGQAAGLNVYAHN